MDFATKLDKAIQKNNSLLCVGLDPDIAKIGKQSIFQFNKKIIDQTAEFASCFKPQIAFYAAAGLDGIKDLKKTIDYIHKNTSIPVLLDAKRGDVANTSEMYAKEVFDFFVADAVTVNLYMGFDAIEPFLKRNDKWVFVLCRTSNQGALDLQDLKVGDKPMYVEVATKVQKASKKNHNIGLVVGATWPNEMKTIRQIAKDLLILVPGIGEQGGNLKEIVKNGLTKNKKGLILNSSRGIIYDKSPREAAIKLRDEINQYKSVN